MNVQDRLATYLTRTPSIDPSAWVSPHAVVIGAVTLGPQASVWPMAVLRGDIEQIVVGRGSNIQDGSIVHLADDLGVHIGEYVTVGHAAIIHACTIGDECLIGMRATILDGAVIGARSIIGAGAVVTKGMVVPPGSLVLGMPAKVVRALSTAEQDDLRSWAEKYTAVAAAHRQLAAQAVSA
jgi:gamma-carbonic anhydrase